MREILYRGKSESTKEWAYGLYLRFPDDEVGVGCASDESGIIDGQIVYPDSIGQFAEMVDSYGTMIFENDIIEAKQKGIEEVIEEDDVYRFVCKFGMCGGVQNTLGNVGYMGFYFEPADKVTKKCAKFGLRDDPIYWLNEYDCRVIGNTTDNPELLEA